MGRGLGVQGLGFRVLGFRVESAHATDFAAATRPFKRLGRR